MSPGQSQQGSTPLTSNKDEGGTEVIGSTLQRPRPSPLVCWWILVERLLVSDGYFEFALLLKTFICIIKVSGCLFVFPRLEQFQ